MWMYRSSVWRSLALHSQIITKTLGSINPHTNSSITDMACPSGYLVAGGGPKSGYSNFTMMWNSPLNTTTWRAEAYNDSGSGAINVDVQIVCLAVSGLHSQIISKSLGSINRITNSTIADSPCPSGYLVASGGPNSGYSNFTLMWSAPLNTTTWQSEAYNDNSSGAINVDMQIACLKHKGIPREFSASTTYRSKNRPPGVFSWRPALVDGLASGYGSCPLYWFDTMISSKYVVVLADSFQR